MFPPPSLYEFDPAFERVFNPMIPTAFRYQVFLEISYESKNNQIYYVVTSSTL